MSHERTLRGLAQTDKHQKPPRAPWGEMGYLVFEKSAEKQNSGQRKLSSKINWAAGSGVARENARLSWPSQLPMAPVSSTRHRPTPADCPPGPLDFARHLWPDRVHMAATDPETTGLPGGRDGDRLDSWKEIANHFGRGVTTVQRWEQEEGLPVRRLPHAKKGSVFAYRHELDAWHTTRSTTAQATPPQGTVRAAETPASDIAPPTPPTRSWRRVAPIGASLAALVTVGAWWLQTGPPAVATEVTRTETAVTRMESLLPTALADSNDDERAPSLAPDGRQVVFARSEAHRGGLYVQDLPTGTPRPIWTFTPWAQAVYITKWSPDGRWIAFNSVEGDDVYGLYVIPPSGGPARRLTSMAGVGICWTPDSQSVTFVDRTSASEPFSLYSINLETRQRVRVTSPPQGSFGDTACAWSQDGRRLALARFGTRYDADVMLVVPMSHIGEKKLATGNGGIDDLAWTPDGRSILFTNDPGLRMVPADGATAPTTVAAISGSIAHPSFAGERLAYQVHRTELVASLWRAATPNRHEAWPGEANRSSEFPALSRDGARLAFVRGGQVWVSDARRGQRHQVSFHGDAGRIVTTPQWSPDGRRLAFSVSVGGQRDIYLVDADGSHSFRLTSEPSLEDNPSWSQDGRWIYFRSDRAGHSHIWKAPSTGGAAVRVTTGEASQAQESWDGTSLYFVRHTNQTGLWQATLTGNDERLVLPTVTESRWAVTTAGIVFVDGWESEQPTLRLWTGANTAPRVLTTLPSHAAAGLAASPDGQTVLWTRPERQHADVMLATWRP